jgi:hypothetical protein
MVYAAYLHRALCHNETKICLYVPVRTLVRTILPKPFVHRLVHPGRIILAERKMLVKKEHHIILDETDARCTQNTPHHPPTNTHTQKKGVSIIFDYSFDVLGAAI